MKKSAHYRRCVNFDDQRYNLQETLQRVLRNAPANATPTYPLLGDSVCLVARRPRTRGRLFLNLIAIERGAGAAVVQALRDAEEVDTDEAGPPQGSEFVQAQVLCLVDGNVVLWTTHNSVLRESSVSTYLQRLIQHFGGDDDDHNFLLRADLDAAQLNAALENGIEAIDLNVGGFRSTLEEAFDVRQPGRGGVIGHLLSFVRERPTAEEMEAAADISVKFTLLPGRAWRQENVRDFLADVGRELYEQRDEYEDGFAIVTKNGMRLTRSKLTVSRAFNADGNRALINALQVRDRLHEIMDELQGNGVAGG